VIEEVTDRTDLQRLKSMGICIGRSVEVIKQGDPLILKVYGTRIGLSARLADHVQVSPCEYSPRCWEREPVP
jgi:Fe2+ transport system protein FeoA